MPHLEFAVVGIKENTMLSNVLIIFNLFILESLLSIDNAAVLAVMVNDLPVKQRSKALKYGIFGAFLFRGMALLLATYIVKIYALKIIGGIYLLYLSYGHFTPKKDTIEEGIDKEHNKVYAAIKKSIGAFWSTVILVEIMDMAFSVDNIFAAAAMTSNIYLILIGVCIGIVSMRFVASWFSNLIVKYPSLENSAFIVIALLGLKLVFTGIVQLIPSASFINSYTSTHLFDFIFSACMMLIFFLPIINLRTNGKS